MASQDALCGLGMAPQLAALIGGNPSVLTTVGVAQATAAKIKSKNTELLTAGGATGAIFPTGTNIFEPYFIVNPTATTGVIYPPVGDTFGGTLNGSLNLPQNKAAIIWQYKKGFWTYIVLA